MAHPLPRSLCIALLAACACGEPKPGDSDSGSTTGASDPGTTTEDGSATATGPATTGDPQTSTGTTGPATTTDATTGDATTGTTGDATGTTTSTTDTTGGPLCELVHLTCARAELNRDFEDCGIVDPDSTTEQWQAARDCALAAVAEQRAFKLVTWLQGIDSTVGFGYVGLEGVTYGVERLFFDSFIEATTDVVSCADLAGVPNCTVEPGEACLDCEGASESEQLCP
jgi:hypothetical protein